MTDDKQIFVERETYEKGGKTYFSYFIKGMVRGKDVRVAVTPPDVGGYAVLDIVFDGAKSAQLVTKPYEMKTDDGKVISGNTYAVQSFDEDGLLYECAVKPFRASDRTLLNMLLR
jgi:hypothetical protein